jgi:nicotinamide phosphoribosyltransferase
VLPIKNVLVTIVNTDPKCFWLPSFLETAMMRAVWYPTTVATISYTCKQIIREYLDKTCDDPAAELPFKLHDFGARGVSSKESAGLGGVAHLVNFMGTDTVEALLYARRYYGESMAGFSIPAAEHSTITSWVEHDADNETGARREGETASYLNMLRRFGKPNALVACVSDSYDLFYAIEHIWGGSLKNEVLAMGGRLVVRPDSGNPPEIVLKSVELLGKTFGFTVNSKGYKVLHPSVRVIQGDGINVHSIPVILKTLTDAGWSAENVTFGMGGGLLQLLNRDTMKFAMKCSSIMLVNGVWRDVYKEPTTDYGKGSKKGRLALITENGYYETVRFESNQWRDALHEVYRDGEIRRTTTLAEIRERSNRAMVGDTKAAA